MRCSPPDAQRISIPFWIGVTWQVVTLPFQIHCLKTSAPAALMPKEESVPLIARPEAIAVSNFIWWMWLVSGACTYYYIRSRVSLLLSQELVCWRMAGCLLSPQRVKWFLSSDIRDKHSPCMRPVLPNLIYGYFFEEVPIIRNQQVWGWNSWVGLHFLDTSHGQLLRHHFRAQNFFGGFHFLDSYQVQLFGDLAYSLSGNLATKPQTLTQDYRWTWDW